MSNSRIRIRKVVIPVAGLGTRMLPATKSIPKEMLTLIDKPLIQFIVSECAAAGLKEIILVTHSSKNCIENHFDTSYELEMILGKSVKKGLLSQVRAILPKDVTIIAIRQEQTKGLGDAIYCAKSLIGSEPFAVVLPDVILDEYSVNQSIYNLSEMLKVFEDSGNSQIMVQPVPYNDISNYGIVDCNGAKLMEGERATIKRVVEKPLASNAPSNLGVVGRYVFSAEIFSFLEKTQPDASGEIQLTDAIEQLINSQTVEAYHLKGSSYDCGTKLGYAKAFVEYAINHTELGDQFYEWLRARMVA